MLLALPYLFEFWAMPHQLPPDGAWRSWVILGGRGAGKTRAGAEWVRAKVEGARPLDAGAASRVALVGETFDQVRQVMIEGPSGILACSPPDRRPEWQATKRRLVWPNGATAQAISAHEPESLRGPQFDAAWADELGCPAVDKGANEPNRFYDPKSSESALPKHSSGARDDLMQMQFLRAHLSWWRSEANNPVSPIYGGSMVNAERSFIWAWDARPYPVFPNNRELWSDGANYGRGHWLNGRSSARSLASVVAEICASSGLTDIDVTRLYGLVRGYSVPHAGTAREALQPLMLAFGFDAFERGGQLVFQTRSGRVDHVVDTGTVAVTGETEGDLEVVRAPVAETAGRVRVSAVEAEGDYRVRSNAAVFPDELTRNVAENELPLLLTQAEARATAERWLSDARIGRDRVRFALAPSQAAVGAGDVVALRTDGSGDRFRIDRVEDFGARLVEGVRVEPQSFGSNPDDEETDAAKSAASFVPAAPVFPVYLDLPLLRGSEVPHAPHIAVFADPWPGGAAVFSSDASDGFSLNSIIRDAAVVGETKTILSASDPARWDPGAALRVRLFGGALSSVAEAAVLNGANAAAIGEGAGDDWEIFQFATAELVGPATYDLRLRLRGQAGTDALMPDFWPVGSRFVLLSAAIEQLEMPLGGRGLVRNYRVGPANRPVDDPVYAQSERAFDGVGLRPLAPVHLRSRRAPGGEIALNWIRRTRVDGDSWAGVDVPLGESREAYLVRVISDGSIVREEMTTEPGWVYGAVEQTADAIAAPYEIAVAQVSDAFGPGLFRKVTIDG